MARPKKPELEEWIVYLAARTAAAAITSFDVEFELRVAASIGRLLYKFDRRHRERTLQHLELVFPENSRGENERIAQCAFEHFVQLAIEVIYSPRLIHANSWPSCIRTKNLGETVKLLNSNQPTILLTGHIGNWEVLGNLLAVLGYPIHALARPIDHRKINDWLLGIREAKGMKIVTKWDATDTMVDILRGGGTLGFIADQNAGDRGMFVPFFGRLASSYKSIGLLAMNFNAPIICGYAARTGPGFRFEVGIGDIIRPEDWADRRDPLYYITARYNRAIESMVRSFPGQYVWMHRRWRSRPRYEYQGKSMTAALRRNLEELPWMDESTLDQLAEPLDIYK